VRARALHPWRVGYRDAVAIQEFLRARLRLTPLPARIRLVAGTDVAYSRPTHRMYAAVVVVALPSLDVVEVAEAHCRARFPYVPGLFTFRELPPLLRAFRGLRSGPDVLLFDGQGLAHPRRFGLACHGGLLLGRPSVGCAKSRLVGTHGPLGPERGATAELVFEGGIVGAALRTQRGVTPVYVSPGHRADVGTSVGLVLACTGRFRLPEPIRLAHQATTALRRRLDPTLSPPQVRSYPDFLPSGAPPLNPSVRFNMIRPPVK
jgi:deoxyribonuclease V